MSPEQDLKSDADILKKFCEGMSLTEQFTTADLTRKAYIATNLDDLIKMITNHKRIMREIENEKTRKKHG